MLKNTTLSQKSDYLNRFLVKFPRNVYFYIKQWRHQIFCGGSRGKMRFCGGKNPKAYQKWLILAIFFFWLGESWQVGEEPPTRGGGMPHAPLPLDAPSGLKFLHTLLTWDIKLWAFWQKKKIVNHFWQSVDAILETVLWLKQLFDAKPLIWRLYHLSVFQKLR